MKLKCAACGEKMKNKKGDIDLRINGKLYIVSNVEFEECLNCGEIVLQPDINDNIYKLISSKNYKIKETKIPFVELVTS